MAANGSVIIDTRMDTTGVQKGVSAIKQSFNGLGSAVKKIGLLIGGAFAVGKLVQFGKECIELGSDLAEVQNVVDVTFTTMSDKVNEFAKNAMTSAGLSEETSYPLCLNVDSPRMFLDVSVSGLSSTLYSSRSFPRRSYFGVSPPQREPASM